MNKKKNPAIKASDMYVSLDVSKMYAPVSDIPLTPEQIANGEAGIVYAPYIPICTHVIVSDKTGTHKYRQVSRYTLLKLWLYKKTKIKRLLKNL